MKGRVHGELLIWPIFMVSSIREAQVMPGKFTAAVVQDGSVVFDRKKTIEKISRLTADAAKEGAALVLFPEAFVSGVLVQRIFRFKFLSFQS